MKCIFENRNNFTEGPSKARREKSESSYLLGKLWEESQGKHTDKQEHLDILPRLKSFGHQSREESDYH